MREAAARLHHVELPEEVVTGFETLDDLDDLVDAVLAQRAVAGPARPAGGASRGA